MSETTAITCNNRNTSRHLSLGPCGRGCDFLQRHYM